MKQYPFFILLFSLLIGGCGNNENELKITEYVRPFIGTAGNGQCFPGAVRPFGGIQISPDYPAKYEDNQISSFSHTRLSGKNTGDLQDIRLLPVISHPDSNQAPSDYIHVNYASYSPDNEQAEAGYYSVVLDNGIKTEITVTNRCGIHYYQYPVGTTYALTIDLGTAAPEDSTLEAAIRKVNNRTLEGYRKSSGFLKEQKVYFVIEFSQDCNLLAGNEKFTPLENGQKFTGKRCYAWVDFGSHTNKILAKISISTANTEGATANLEKELSHWSFDKVRRDAKQSWRRELIKTRAEGTNEKQLEIFYTALYHAYLSPFLFSDVNGNYKGPDGEIHSVKRTTQYTVFPLELTYRNLWPLLTITQKKRMPDLISSMLKYYDACGLLPQTEIVGNAIQTNGSNPAIPIITEAYLKGIRNFNTEKAWQAMKKTIQTRAVNLTSMLQKFEYAYEDWCMTQMARALGQEDNNLTDGDMQVKLIDELSLTDSCPLSCLGAVPYDIPGLITSCGGKKAFLTTLDRIFSSGQYKHSQAACQVLPYLYSYVGRDDKTQYYINLIRTQFYDNTPDGLCGNENYGQLSAWYVFAALGFYPVNPAESKYILGTPLFRKVVLKTGPEKRFTIIANKENDNYIYVQEVLLNGEKLHRNWITHDEIMNGGELEFVLTTEPATLVHK